MPLPNIQEFIGTNVKQSGFKSAQAKLIDYIAGLSIDVAASQGGAYSFTTIANFESNKVNVPANSKVEITSGADAGSYNYDGTNLTKSDYDPLKQAKNYFEKNYTNQKEIPVSQLNLIDRSYNIDLNSFETFTSWKTYILDLSGKEKALSGEFAAHYNGANGSSNTIKLPYVTFLDKYGNYLDSIIDSDAFEGKVSKLFVLVPDGAATAIFSYTVATGYSDYAQYAPLIIYYDAENTRHPVNQILDVLQSNGLRASSNKVVQLKDVAYEPTIINNGLKNIAAFQKWFSYKLDLTGVASISGNASAYRNNISGASTVNIPAMVIFDKDGNEIKTIEANLPTLGVVFDDLLDISTDITNEMNYAILSCKVEQSPVVEVIYKNNEGESVVGLLNNIKYYLNEDGNVDPKLSVDILTAAVNDSIVFVGNNGSYTKTGSYQKWYCKKIDLSDVKSIALSCSGYNYSSIRLPAFIIFNSNDEIIQYADVSQNPGWTTYRETLTITDDMAYAYVQYFIDIEDQYVKRSFLDFIRKSITQRLNLIESEIGSASELSLLHPKVLYNVANDIDYKVANQNYTGQRSALKRNFSAVIHLDNFIQDASSEPNIKFEDGLITKIIPAYSPIINDGAIENPNLNGGSSVYEENISYSVVNNLDSDQNRNLTNRSVLNSASKDKTPTILVIGDSVSFGQDAYFAGGTDKWNYTMILNKMFMNDREQNSGSGYRFRTIGTISYVDKDGNKSFNEAYSGQTLQGNGLFTNPKFLDANGYFNFQAWLDRYRTCDDSGNRLYFNTSGATTGTAGSNNTGYLASGTATSFKIGSLISDTMSLDVYKPTHVFCFHASNQSIDKANYDLFINRVRAVFPDSIIGLGVPHVAGTYFPSKYPKVHRSAIWQYDQTYNNRHVQTMKVLLSDFANTAYEENKVFVLPTFFVNPSVDAFSSIKVNNPYADVIEAEETLTMAVGQRVDVHVGAKAQAAYAYQLYAWLKWTAASNLF